VCWRCHPARPTPEERCREAAEAGKQWVSGLARWGRVCRSGRACLGAVVRPGCATHWRGGQRRTRSSKRSETDRRVVEATSKGACGQGCNMGRRDLCSAHVSGAEQGHDDIGERCPARWATMMW
jgi:hypothetical protein